MAVAGLKTVNYTGAASLAVNGGESVDTFAVTPGAVLEAEPDQHSEQAAAKGPGAPAHIDGL